MDKELLDEREFELVNIIGGQLAANQRELSRQMNLSLGMTNMLLKRLVIKGYIRIKQLDRRKVEYILTSKGFTEKMRKSVHYTVKTIRSIGLIRRQLDALIHNLYSQGDRAFFVLGTSDLAELVEMSLMQPKWAGVKVSRIEEAPAVLTEGIVLICREGEHEAVLEGIKHIDVVKELAHEYTHGT